ncbi:sigma-70 family RNA polymerase sigma factor [Lysinibacillus antri]|uniref:sigma-70 family RNA polymerase sigma factor n=1 Tax=Lysinibacillus antri TaxID=2498145 RepID=UPI001FED286F|nr:sigma-70 family RNA polymerase sigma factor [Lysinibacillus antri]
MITNLEHLVIKAIEGDKDAFCQLVKEVEPSLYRIAYSILRSDEDCLDAAQEAIMKAYVSIHTLKHPQYFKTWLIRILIRECTALLKERNKVVALNSDVKEPHATYHMEDNLELNNAIRNLEADHRVVITLFYLQDLSVKDIAEIIEQPVGTVKSRLSRARNKLKEMLSEKIQVGGLQHEQI